MEDRKEGADRKLEPKGQAEVPARLGIPWETDCISHLVSHVRLSLEIVQPLP